jgi:hypothetical protein
MVVPGKSLHGVEDELKERIILLVLSDSTFSVSSAYRDPEHQIRLYNEWMRGYRKYGNDRDKAMSKGFVPANPPGISKHCKKPACAVDVYAPEGKEAKRAQKAREFGLHTPIKDEPWHMELDPKRKPLQSVVSIKSPEPITTLSKDVSVGYENAETAELTPSGNGRWVLDRDGGVRAYAFNDENGNPLFIPFHGSAFDYPDIQQQKGRFWVRIQALGATDSDGYALIANDGFTLKLRKN